MVPPAEVVTARELGSPNATVYEPEVTAVVPPEISVPVVVTVAVRVFVPAAVVNLAALKATTPAVGDALVVPPSEAEPVVVRVTV